MILSGATMRITVLKQYAKGLAAHHHDREEAEGIDRTLRRVKGFLWHGNIRAVLPCRAIEQPTQHSGLNIPGTSRRLRHADGNDASVRTREGHDAIHAAPDARRTP